MKITKKAIKACDVISTQESAQSLNTLAVCECKYQNAIDLISAAIESLAVIAKDDEIAKDSIANLGVVMLDLKGNCSCE
jgi:hypothetical protein